MKKVSMKFVGSIFLAWSLFLLANTCKAQSPYPASPSFEQIVADIKKDEILKSLENNGVPAQFLSQVRFERINANDKKNFPLETNYYYENASTFKDRLYYIVIAVIPKAAFNATFRIPIQVDYTRYKDVDGNWMILNKWEYYSYRVMVNSMVSPPDLKMPSKEEKKKIIVDYLKANCNKKDQWVDGSFNEYQLSHIVKIDGFGVYTKYEDLGVDENYGLGKYYWYLTMDCGIANEISKEGVKSIERRYPQFKFMVEMRGSKFEIVKIYSISDNSSEDEIVKSGLTPNWGTEQFDQPKRIGNLLVNGWDEVQAKYAAFKLMPGTSEDLELYANKWNEIVKKFMYSNDEEKNVDFAFKAGLNFDNTYMKIKTNLLDGFSGLTKAKLVSIVLLDNPNGSEKGMTSYEYGKPWIDGNGNPVPPKGIVRINPTYKVEYEYFETRTKKKTSSYERGVYIQLELEFINGVWTIVDIDPK